MPSLSLLSETQFFELMDEICHLPQVTELIQQHLTQLFNTMEGVQHILIVSRRFKVTEHFPDHGKSYDTLLTDVTQRAAQCVPVPSAEEKLVTNAS